MFKCTECNKEYKYSSGLSKHRTSVNSCSFKLLQNRLLLLEEENRLLIEDNKQLNIELETLKHNPQTINNITNNHITNTQQNVIQVQCKTSKEYMNTLEGIPKIDFDSNKIIGKIQEMANRLAEHPDPKKIHNAYNYMNMAFNENNINENSLITNVDKNKVHIKYDNVSKPLEEHIELLSDVSSIANESKDKAMNMDIPTRQKRKITNLEDIYSRKSVNHAKRTITQKNPHKTWKSIKDSQIFELES